MCVYRRVLLPQPIGLCGPHHQTGVYRYKMGETLVLYMTASSAWLIITTALGWGEEKIRVRMIPSPRGRVAPLLDLWWPGGRGCGAYQFEISQKRRSRELQDTQINNFIQFLALGTALYFHTRYIISQAIFDVWVRIDSEIAVLLELLWSTKANKFLKCLSTVYDWRFFFSC